VKHCGGSGPAKFQEPILKFGLEWRKVAKMCGYQLKIGCISDTVRYRAKLTINH